MLNRAPVPPYGFNTYMLNGGATLILHTPEFPCDLDNPDGYTTTRGDHFLQLAVTLGLHVLPSPTVNPGPAAHPWLFRIPYAARRAAIHGPDAIKIVADTAPEIDQAWWNNSVMDGGRCTLITTTGLLARATSRKLQPDTIHAHGGHRIVGATIPVEF